MTDDQKTYVPAAGEDWALALYDPIVKLLGGDAARRVLVDQAELRDGHDVLEIGCGTGSLLVSIKQRHPRVNVVGLDPDPLALERAKRKAAAASFAMTLDRGFSEALPYPEASFDRVFSCFMLHHLQGRDRKQRTLQEVRRVLRPGGSLHLVDFSTAHSRRTGLLMRWLHPHHLEQDGDERVRAMMADAGLANATVLLHRTLFLIMHGTYFKAAR